jgi:hypothetical protein
MMYEYAIRFVLGGFLVSAFAMLGDILRPKSFAGLFGAAPSVALATLAIAIVQHGPQYAAVQSRSMAIGAVALTIYSMLVCHLLMRTHGRALTTTLVALVGWLVVAGGLYNFVPGSG